MKNIKDNKMSKEGRDIFDDKWKEGMLKFSAEVLMEIALKSEQDLQRLRELDDVTDSINFMADALGEEVRLRQMIDLWCIDQFGNTDEALEKADEMFTAARDIFYK